MVKEPFNKSWRILYNVKKRNEMSINWWLQTDNPFLYSFSALIFSLFKLLSIEDTGILYFLLTMNIHSPWISLITTLFLSFCLQSKESNYNKKFIQEWKIRKIDFYLKLEREGKIQSPWQYTVIKEIFEPVEKSNTSNPGSWTPYTMPLPSLNQYQD